MGLCRIASALALLLILGTCGQSKGADTFTLYRNAARETDGACRRNQPCPTATADVARDAVVRLVGAPVGLSREGHMLVKGPALTCHSLGNGRGARTAA